jgi:lipid-A-disaccharide synthase
MARKFLFVAGDFSGDIHASHVVRNLKEEAPDAYVISIGGPELRKVSDLFLEDLVGEGLFGFWEPVKKIPWLWRLLRNVLVPAIEEHRPDVVIPVDFFGFNRKTIQLAKEQNVTVKYLVSPQIWASRPGRIETLRKYVDKMIVLFPFEAELYRKAGMDVAFYGHPLLDLIPEISERDSRTSDQPVIGLLPGSRVSEVRAHLPFYLEAAAKVTTSSEPLSLLLFAARSVPERLYDEILATAKVNPDSLEVVWDENYQRRSNVDFAVTTSGTATLENALLGIPMVVLYRTSWLNYQLAKALIKVPYISIVNILAGQEVVPELIQQKADAVNLAEEMKRIIFNPQALKNKREELLAIRRMLGSPGVYKKIAVDLLST